MLVEPLISGYNIINSCYFLRQERQQMFVDNVASTSRTFFRILVSPLVHRYRQEDPRQYPWLEKNMANIVSVFRILASLVIALGLVNADGASQRYMWLFLAMLNIATDGIDGEIARGLKTESDFGKVVDPLADKITFGSLAIGLFYYFSEEIGSTPYVFLAIVLCALLFEVRVIVTGAKVGYLAKKAQISPDGANSYGKVKFGLQCMAVVLGWGIPSADTAIWVSSVLIAVAIYFSVMSRRGYLRQLQNIKKKLYD